MLVNMTPKSIELSLSGLHEEGIASSAHVIRQFKDPRRPPAAAVGPGRRVPRKATGVFTHQVNAVMSENSIHRRDDPSKDAVSLLSTPSTGSSTET